MTNSEQSVLDEIAELEQVEDLVDWQLTQDDVPAGQEICSICQYEWHGLPFYGCPGAWSTTAERRNFRRRRARSKKERERKREAIRQLLGRPQAKQIQEIADNTTIDTIL